MGGGIADAAGSFAQGTVAVADTAGNAVANALDAVAGIFRGRRLAALLPATVTALSGNEALLQLRSSASRPARSLSQTSADGEQPPSLGSCTLADLGVSPAAAALMSPPQQAALQEACRALLRLSPAQEAELEAAMQAAAEPFLEELAQVALPLPLALIGDALGPQGKRGAGGCDKWVQAGCIAGATSFRTAASFGHPARYRLFETHACASLSINDYSCPPAQVH